jgi:hypothetical protein
MTSNEPENSGKNIFAKRMTGRRNDDGNEPDLESHHSSRLVTG